MSPREQVANQLADTCVFGGLNDSYGVTVTRLVDPKGRTYWSVTFARARTLDGVIRVYSPAFILVRWQGQGGGQEVFRSVEAARAFLTQRFVTQTA